MPGAELTREMYRWEQRCYTYTMQFSYNALHKSAQSAAAVPAPLDHPHSPLHALSVATGGRAVQLTSLRQLFASLELLATRIAQPAVVVQCEWLEQSSAAVLWLTNQVTAAGYWPFPEDALTHVLQPRAAHPLLRLTAERRAEGENGTEHGWTVEEIPGKFPFDKYTIEHAALTEHLTQHRDTHYAVTLVHNNGTTSPPFAYIKSSAHKSSASLYVLPYNYPKLFALLVKWNKFVVQKTAVTAKWRQDFEAYLTAVPAYYLPPLRNGLKRWNAAMAQFIPDHIAVDMGLSVPLVQQLSKIKLAAKTEIDRREALVVPRDAAAVADQRLAFLHRLLTAPRTHAPNTAAALTLDTLLAPRTSPSPAESAALHSVAREISAQAHSVAKNVFEVEREQLREQIDRLRDVVLGRGSAARPISARPARPVLQPSVHHRAYDKRHSVPISEMGNYQEFLKKAPELRPVDEEEHRRAELMQHNFGNPFALKKKTRSKKSLALDVTAIDEADLGVTSAAPDLEIGNEAKFMKERQGVKRGVISVTGPNVNERPLKKAKLDATITAVTPVTAAPAPMTVEDVKATPAPEIGGTVPLVADKPSAPSVNDKKPVKDVKKTPAPSPLKASVKAAPAPVLDAREQVHKYRAVKAQLCRLMRSAAVSASSVLKQLDELALPADRAHLAHYLSTLAALYRRTQLESALLAYHKSIKLTAV